MMLRLVGVLTVTTARRGVRRRLGYLVDGTLRAVDATV